MRGDGLVVRDAPPSSRGMTNPPIAVAVDEEHFIPEQRWTWATVHDPPVPHTVAAATTTTTSHAGPITKESRQKTTIRGGGGMLSSVPVDHHPDVDHHRVRGGLASVTIENPSLSTVPEDRMMMARPTSMFRRPSTTSTTPQGAWPTVDHHSSSTTTMQQRRWVPGIPTQQQHLVSSADADENRTLQQHQQAQQHHHHATILPMRESVMGMSNEVKMEPYRHHQTTPTNNNGRTVYQSVETTDEPPWIGRTSSSSVRRPLHPVVMVADTALPDHHGGTDARRNSSHGQRLLPPLNVNTIDAQPMFSTPSSGRDTGRRPPTLEMFRSGFGAQALLDDHVVPPPRTDDRRGSRDDPRRRETTATSSFVNTAAAVVRDRDGGRTIITIPHDDAAVDAGGWDRHQTHHPRSAVIGAAAARRHHAAGTTVVTLDSAPPDEDAAASSRRQQHSAHHTSPPTGSAWATMKGVGGERDSHHHRGVVVTSSLSSPSVQSTSIGLPPLAPDAGGARRLDGTGPGPNRDRHPWDMGRVAPSSVGHTTVPWHQVLPVWG